jgi:hypothetical protein
MVNQGGHFMDNTVGNDCNKAISLVQKDRKLENKNYLEFWYGTYIQQKCIKKLLTYIQDLSKFLITE